VTGAKAGRENITQMIAITAGTDGAPSQKSWGLPAAVFPSAPSRGREEQGW